MQIYKIESDRKYGLYGATVSLDYDELQILSHIFCEMEDDDQLTKRTQFWELARNFHFLFDIVKNSGVDNRTFDNAYERVEKIRELYKEEEEND